MDTPFVRTKLNNGRVTFFVLDLVVFVDEVSLLVYYIF